MALDVGQEAPNFTLNGTDGQFTLSEALQTTNVLLVFYPRDATPGCTRQLCEIRDAFPRYQLGETQVLGVNPGSLASHTKFKEKQQLPFPLLVDEGAGVAQSYQAVKANGTSIERTVVLIGQDGRILLSQPGMPPSEEILAYLE